MLRLPPLGAIEAFVVVARLGSIKNAAEALALSASALSRRVQTLESRLGQELFERQHQKLLLTAAGNKLLEAIAPIIDELGAAFERATHGDELRLRLASVPLFASHVLIPHLPHLRDAHPELHVDIETAPLPLNRLGESLDAAILLATEIDPKYYARKIGHARIVALASKEMVLSGRAPQSVADLENHTILVHRMLGFMIETWFEAQGLPPMRRTDTIQFDSGHLLLDAAASGMGICFMLDTLTATDERVQPLFNVTVDSPHQHWFVCRQTAVTSKSIRLFHDWLFSEFPDGGAT